jgi:lysophospholipase L1-like esterase
MANNAVYPYGTDGQLPASIGIINDLTTGGADKALSAQMGKVLNTQDIDASRVKVGASGMRTIGAKSGGNPRYVSNNDFRYPNYPPVGYHILKLHASSNMVTTATIGIYTPGEGISGTQSFNLVNGDVATDVDITVPVGSYLCIGNAKGLRFADTGNYGSYNISASQTSNADLSLWFDVEITSIGIDDYVQELVDTARPCSLVQIFPKLTTVGDSLMAGYTHQGSITVNSATARAAGNNWPTYLAKRNGLDVNNLAIGSSTAHHWRYADGPSAGNLADITAANIPTDCYYIGVGVNDLRDSVTVGTSADIAASVASNADTFYGNYDYIVRACLSYNAKAHIFAFTIPDSEAGNAPYNAAIQYVCDLYDRVHCLDLTAIDDFTGGLIARCFANGHYDPLAYNLISTIIESLTNDYIQANYDDFIVAPY